MLHKNLGRILYSYFIKTALIKNIRKGLDAANFTSKQQFHPDVLNTKLAWNYSNQHTSLTILSASFQLFQEIFIKINGRLAYSEEPAFTIFISNIILQLQRYS